MGEDSSVFIKLCIYLNDPGSFCLNHVYTHTHTHTHKYIYVDQFLDPLFCNINLFIYSNNIRLSYHGCTISTNNA